MNKPLPATDLVARLRTIAWGYKGNYEPIENKAANEIERLRIEVRLLKAAYAEVSPCLDNCRDLRAEVARLTEALDAAHAKELAATFKALAPAEKAPAANVFASKLKERQIGLTYSLGNILACAAGLDSKNPVVRLQAEADVTAAVAAAFKDYGFSTVNVKLVYFRGGDFYAAVTVPSGSDGDYCRAVQELTGFKLRCVPA